MQKTLAALGGFRRAGVFRQALDDAGHDLDRVLHPALREAGMGADAFDDDRGAIGRKRLVLDMAGGFTIHRVGEIRTELLQVGLVDTAADLLVGREQDLDSAVPDLRIGEQDLRGVHDFGDTGLVVRAEQRGAIRGDDVVADLVGQRRIVRSPDHLGRVAGKPDVAAAIIPNDLRLDAGPRTIRRGVHVGAEADHRHGLGGVRGDRRVDVAVGVHMRVGETHRQQFADQQTAEVFLFFGGRAGRRGRVRLGVDDDVAEKALGDRMRECLGRGHDGRISRKSGQ